jgi:glycosyltransferase involved in cell wall biosynthesis
MPTDDGVETDSRGASVQRPGGVGPIRIAYLSYGAGLYDARTFRMARSAREAGYHVTVYARWHPGLASREERDGYRIIRVPIDWRLAIPGLRGSARRNAARAMLTPWSKGMYIDRTDDGQGPGPDLDAPAVATPRRGAVARIVHVPRRGARRATRRIRRAVNRWWRLVRAFPLWPLGWASALEDVAEPADIWHGMWAGSLPALQRLRRRHGGRTIYDSRDIFMQSRGYAGAGRPGVTILRWFERHWAQAADRVLTVNEHYADILTGELGIARPTVIMNCPERWQPPTPRPDRIRERLGLSGDTPVVLYQGGLMSGRGLEQTVEAILDVPGAFLCLLGWGALRDRLVRQASTPPYAGRLAVLPPVRPEDLLSWTASADVCVMAIQPTSVNHRYTTPQKLFESLAAGVPVVAADLPAMAEIVVEHRVGVVCDPTSPVAIAAAIRSVISAPPLEREAMRQHVLEVAHERYAWESQRDALLGVYRDLR